MTSDEPTLGEVIRRLDAVSTQMNTLAKQMAEDRRDFASTYVRYDLYQTRHEFVNGKVDAVSAKVDALRDDFDAKDKTAADTRRQLMFIVLATALPACAGFLLSLLMFIARGGVG